MRSNVVPNQCTFLRAPLDERPLSARKVVTIIIGKGEAVDPVGAHLLQMKTVLASTKIMGRQGGHLLLQYTMPRVQKWTPQNALGVGDTSFTNKTYNFDV
jgi:hypothetical protein